MTTEMIPYAQFIAVCLILFALLVVGGFLYSRAVSQGQGPPREPDVDASDEEWAVYYRRLADDAQRNGDRGRAEWNRTLAEDCEQAARERKG